MRTDLVAETERQLRALARLEPDNAAWPYLLAYSSFARSDLDRGLRYVEDSAGKPEFSLHHKDELKAEVGAYTGLGLPRPEAILHLEAYFVFPELHDITEVAKTARAQADALETEGKLKQAVRIRLALIDVGRLMAREEEYLIAALVGRAVADTGYGFNDAAEEAIPSGDEEEYETVRLKRAKFREAAFLDLLDAAGVAYLGPRYAHGLEDTVAYTSATQEYVEAPSGDWRTRAYVQLGAGYLAPRLTCQALACTVALLTLVGVVSTFVRRRSHTPGTRTIVGVSIVGGVTCLGMVAAIGVLMRLWMYELIALFESDALPTANGYG